MMSNSLQEIVCCLGQPVAGNPTQYMLEKAFAAAGLDWEYLTCEVPPDRLSDAIKGIRALGFRGANLTIPHKVAVLEHLDELSPAAQAMGAVNCIHRVGEKLVGDNADGKGFVQSLRALAEPAGQKAVILGAGGAARAISVELALNGAAEIKVVNRSPERGQALAELLRQKTQAVAEFVPLSGDYSIPPEANVFINATSVGLGNADARVPLAVNSLRPDLIVADVVFNPPQTWLIRTAAERGCKTLDGLGMLVNQAAICFRTWTGRDPDAELMRDALEEFLEI
jgi:shikimate dehydrogenase